MLVKLILNKIFKRSQLQKGCLMKNFNMKNLLLILSTMILTNGCVAVHTASLQKDEFSKKFVPPKDKSNVYLYRNENFGMAIGMPVVVDGKLAGTTGAKTYFNWQLNPGNHTFQSMTENTSVLSLNTEAGKNYFIWQEVKMGLWTARSSLQEVPDDVGRKGVMESKRIESDF